MSATTDAPSTTAIVTSAAAAKRRQGNTPLKYVAWHAWLPVVIVVIAMIVTSLSTNLYFPPLTEVFAETWQRWVLGGGFVEDFLPSLWRLLGGFAIAVVVGILAGTVLGLVKPLEVALRPLTEAARAVPGAALLPLAMMFFGTGEAMKVVMIAFISVWPVMLNTIDGVRSVDPALRNVMRSYRLTRMDQFRFGFLPQATPQVFAGARISLAISIAVMVVVEMFGTPGGIGYFIRHSQSTFKIVDMWTGLLVLIIFGYLINLIFRVLETRILSWHHRMVAHTQGD